MSGQTGGRGYLVQAIVSVLDALADHNWVSVTVEPNVEKEKVDILWRYPKRSKAVQVKSSQNQINVPDVKTWATELEKSIVADEYVISLIGPVSEEVPKLGKHGKVTIPPPKSLDLDALRWQAAYQLYRYMDSQKMPASPALTLELIVDGLVTRFSTFAAIGKTIDRAEFNTILSTWINEINANPPQLLPNTVSLNIQNNLQTVIWQSRIRAFEDLKATASKMINRARPNAEDWSDVCENMAEEFSSTLDQLKTLESKEGQYMSKAVRDLVQQAISLGNDIATKVEYTHGEPEVSLTGREITGKLYNVITQARDRSAKEIRNAAGMGDD